ncbi:hypothetical protein PsorP6_004098 [Peronosclerospora sorghi]|uniref:Uncharacterized protein n=1 Tax=Peronosclerospora sorghi TaxID=230839 RepID=A0ACC0VQU0_9STRA|nr:hypothetical protein PsorP6_004098 [Peronosclerospora sorghi]
MLRNKITTLSTTTNYLTRFSDISEGTEIRVAFPRADTFLVVFLRADTFLVVFLLFNIIFLAADTLFMDTSRKKKYQHRATDHAESLLRQQLMQHYSRPYTTAD